MCQKITGNILVLLAKHSTRGVDQHTAGTDISRGIGENLTLYHRKLLQLGRILVANIRFLTNDAQTAAWHICDNQIGLPVPGCVKLPAVSKRRMNAVYAKTFGAAFYQLQLMRVDITGQDFAPVL